MRSTCSEYTCNCHDDVGFLLTFVKSQEAVGDYSKLAHEIISEYNSPDNPGLLRQKVTEGFAQVATSMRSACVEKVNKKASSYQADADNKSLFPNYRKQMAFAASALREAAKELESVSIQEQEAKQS